MSNLGSILHLPVSYLPWTTGGKEVFCHSLCRELRSLDVDARVVIHQNPPEREPLGNTAFDGVPVQVLEPIIGYGSREPTYSCAPHAIPGFACLLEEVRPSVVHFHDFSVGANLLHMRLSREAGARLVMSYHSPGQSCLQRTLWYRGRENDVCDGEIRIGRCTACRLGVQGVPSWVSRLLTRTPLQRMNPESKSSIRRLLTAPAMTRRFYWAWQECVSLVDAFQVHAHWVVDVLALNGVPSEKIHMIRSGFPGLSGTAHAGVKRRNGNIVLGLVGRCDPVKGIHVLVRAVKLLPASAPLTVRCIGPYWDGHYGAELQKMIAGDPRFELPRLVEPAKVVDAMAELDVCVVPSTWLETGPLVVLEAFAAGVPVIGSRLGGIAELVRDHVDGLLFEPGDANGLASLLRKILERPDMLDELRAGIQKVRSMTQMASEMIDLYAKVVSGRLWPHE